MTIQDAIKTGLPLTRLNRSWTYMNPYVYGAMTYNTRVFPGTYIDPEFFLSEIQLTKEDILADDWKVKFEEFEMEDVE